MQSKRNMNWQMYSENELSSADVLRLTTTDYVRNKVYVDGVLDKILTEEGYLTRMSPGPNSTFFPIYFLKDHLGNNRVAFRDGGGFYELNNYYPSGTLMSTSLTSNAGGVQPYKFGGKELDKTYNLNWYDFEARQYDPTIMRFTTIDPMREKYYGVSPYAYCNNNPVRYIDPDGMRAIYDPGGYFLGTDETGIGDGYVIIEAKNFTQGMSHSDVSKVLFAGEMTDEARSRMDSHVAGLSSRPDYDGVVSVAEGIAWAKKHPGALDNPTPDNMLYIDASKLDFGNLSPSDFKNGEGVSSPINLFDLSLLKSTLSYTLRNTVYALGRVDMILESSEKRTVSIVNGGTATDYDWNLGGEPKRDAFIRAERWRTGLNDSHGFKTYYYGVGRLKK